jgi:hypothetical protein
MAARSPELSRGGNCRMRMGEAGMKSEAVSQSTQNQMTRGDSDEDINLLDVPILLLKRRKFTAWFALDVPVFDNIRCDHSAEQIYCGHADFASRIPARCNLTEFSSVD